MTPEDRDEIHALAEQVRVCGHTYQYGQVTLTCDQEAGHGGRHMCPGVSWPAA